MQTLITDGVRRSRDAGQADTYRRWLNLAKKFLPAVQPQDVHMSAQQAAVYPKFEPFPGGLLSTEALLQTSSQCQFDRPLTYGNIVDATPFGGWFDTNPEDKPWAQVQLPETGELSGIVIVNRYELPSVLDWAVPLKISISADGKTWMSVAQFDKAEPFYRVDLQGKNLRARFVRVERLTGKPQARFGLRSILVYGSKAG